MGWLGWSLFLSSVNLHAIDLCSTTLSKWETTILGGGFSQTVEQARFSPNSKWIAAKLVSGRVALWNVKTRKETFIGIDGYRISGFHFAPNGRDILLRFDNRESPNGRITQHRIQFWDLETATPKQSAIDAKANPFLSRSGRWILIPLGKEIRILDATNLEDTQRRLPRDQGFIEKGDLLLGFRLDSSAHLSSLRTGRELATLAFVNRPHLTGDLATEENLAIVESKDEIGTPLLRNLKDLKPSKTKLSSTNIEKNAKRQGAHLSPRGSWTYDFYGDRGGGSQNQGIFWNTKNGTQVAVLPMAGSHVTFTQDEKFSAVNIGSSVEGRRDRTRLFSQDGTINRLLPGSQGEFIADKYLVTQDDLGDRTIYHFIDISNGRIQSQEALSNHIFFSPDGTRYFYIQYGAIHLKESKN